MGIERLLNVYLDDQSHRELRRHALKLTGNMDDAEDLLSDLVLTIYTNANMQTAQEPLSYFKTCLKNIHINQRKRAARVTLLDPTRLESLPRRLEPSQRELEYRQTVNDLQRALAPYPGFLVDAFIEYHLNGYSINELAILLGMKANSLAQQFRRMREKVRQHAPNLLA